MRHILVAALLSLPLPGICGAITWYLGYWYEEKYPSPDREQDLKNNMIGIIVGSLLSLGVWISLLT